MAPLRKQQTNSTDTVDRPEDASVQLGLWIAASPIGLPAHAECSTRPGGTPAKLDLAPVVHQTAGALGSRTRLAGLHQNGWTTSKSDVPRVDVQLHCSHRDLCPSDKWGTSRREYHDPTSGNSMLLPLVTRELLINFVSVLEALGRKGKWRPLLGRRHKCITTLARWPGEPLCRKGLLSRSSMNNMLGTGELLSQFCLRRTSEIFKEHALRHTPEEVAPEIESTYRRWQQHRQPRRC